MKRKVVFLAAIFTVSAALIVTACAQPPATKTPTATTTPPATTPGVTPTITATPMTEKPQYGGIISVMTATDITVFDPAAMGTLIGPAVAWLVNEQWMDQDWTRGLAGSGHVTWITVNHSLDDFAPWLAESLQMPKPGVFVFQVRRGVRYALNPASEASRLVGGREMTAKDWVDNMIYMLNHPRSAVRAMEPRVAAAAKVEQTGPWEVTFTCEVDPLAGFHWLAYGGGFHFVWPPEVARRYGDNQNWRNSVGTGPYILTDFVPGAGATLVKNAGYWAKDAVGPGKGMQLPYSDGVKILIVPDLSTRLAALRTGKVDLMSGIESEDAKSLMRTTPALKYARYLGGTPMVVAMRRDKADLPFKDKRVRHALMLATDFEGMKNQLYGGDAEILVYPISKDWKRAYMPMNELPAAVQDLYKYNPEKAKKLLAEAGYPTGFKTRMIMLNTVANVDVASVYKSMWAKIGVDVTIETREWAVWSGISAARAYDEMMLTSLWGIYPVYLYFGSMRGPQAGNPSYVNDPPGSDPVIQEAYEKVQEVVFKDPAEADRIHKNLMPYVLEQANYIERPSPYLYAFYWPWLKNHRGETGFKWLRYYWIDQELKKKLLSR